MAEWVDASDLKSELPKGRCRFESGSGHHGYPFKGVAGFWAIVAKGVMCLWVGRMLWDLSSGGALSLMERMTASNS